MVESNRSVAILNSPRPGGPLRWSHDLARSLNRWSSYRAKVITSLRELLWAQIKPPADIVHSALPSCLHLWRRPYVLTVKGDYTIERTIWHRLYSLAIRRADVVTVPSEYLKRRIPALANAIVIPNAVDLEQFIPVQAHDREQVNVVTVSNFWFPEKANGVIRSIRLLDQLGSHRAHYMVVGDGAHLARVRQMATEAVVPVTFVGWVDPRKYFQRADIFLYLSHHDNMPNAVLEAMASGLPVVANPVGAIPEMIVSGTSGLLGETDEELLMHLKRAFDDAALRRTLGSEARRRIEERFSWSKVWQQYEALYRRVERG